MHHGHEHEDDKYAKLERVRALEVENAKLRAVIGAKPDLTMTDFKDISIASSDVCHQTDTRIAKPPNYGEKDSEEEDELYDPVSPPNRYEVRNAVDVSESADRVEEADDGGKDKEGRKASRPSPREAQHEDNFIRQNDDDVATAEPLLDNHVVADGLEKVPVDEDMKRDDTEEKSDGKVGNEMSDGGKGGMKKKSMSQDAASWILLDQGGEIEKDVTAEDYQEDNIPDLVDAVESALERTSKGESRSFYRLVTVLKILLPLVLYMVDELKMLRDKVKELIIRNRHLQKEVRRAQETEKGKQTETVSIGIQDDHELHMPTNRTSNICDRCQEKQSKSVPLDEQDPSTARERETTVPADDEVEAMKAEMKKLRYQIRELQRVNHSWEKYSNKQVARHDIAMKKKGTQLAALEQRRKELEKRLDDKFKQYDQTLIHCRTMADQQKSVATQYKKERDAYRQKYEHYRTEMMGVMHEKDEEIKRLNEVVERKSAPIKESKKPEQPFNQQARVVDEVYVVPTRKSRERDDKQRNTTAAAISASAATANANREKKTERRPEKMRGKQPRGKSVSPPLSPRREQVPEDNGSQMSLTKIELKDQVLLYREQIDVFRSDFNQERRDRETAVGQVDSLKKELEKTKAKLKEIHNKRKLQEHYIYMAARQQGRNDLLPEETQEMRLMEIKQQARGGRKYPAYGRKNAEDYMFEDHLYADIE